jgi:hypothetical protein
MTQTLIKSYLLKDKFQILQDFLEYHRSSSDLSICQSAWSGDHLFVRCKECSRTSDSCICVECFLNANHDGHYFFSKSVQMEHVIVEILIFGNQLDFVLYIKRYLKIIKLIMIYLIHFLLFLMKFFQFYLLIILLKYFQCFLKLFHLEM